MSLSCKMLLLALLLPLFAMPVQAATPEAGKAPLVLVLHSYSPEYSWTRDLQAGIVSVLQAPEVQANFRMEYMDAKHHNSPRYLARLLEIYREKYLGAHFDGVILTDNHALDLVARHRDEFFPHTPIVACGINGPRSIPANAGDMHVILENVALTTLGRFIVSRGLANSVALDARSKVIRW